MDLLTVSNGNTKLDKRNIFSLPAGITCPGAKECKSFALMLNDKTTIQDSPDCLFRCYASSQEAQYPNVYRCRHENLRKIVKAIRAGNAAELIDKSLDKRLKLTRIHESGDFYSFDYLKAWIRVAEINPKLDFYFYSKSLNFFLDLGLPKNMYLTASHGGKFQNLIDYFSRTSKVIFKESEANGLPIDHDDSNCFIEGDHHFCHLLHGTQPKGSEAGKQLAIRKKAKKTNSNIFTGYSK